MADVAGSKQLVEDVQRLRQLVGGKAGAAAEAARAADAKAAKTWLSR